MQQTWFVTGSSRGLGRALAKAVLDAGDRVVATARRPDQLADLVADYGDLVHPVFLDVTDSEAARSAVAEAREHFGGIDVLVYPRSVGGLVVRRESPRTKQPSSPSTASAAFSVRNSPRSESRSLLSNQVDSGPTGPVRR
jgi:NAD(P)-dependent dehydrogenase (short-subunit alcohol dehydrogenase family)